MNKSAMQELIDDILIEKQLGFITENASKRIIDYIDNLYLEKEKEQIIRAFDIGMHECMGYDENPNKYYNETYRL